MKVVANQGASQTQMLAISPLRFFAMVVCASLGRAVAQVNLARAGQAKVPQLAIVETVTPQCWGTPNKTAGDGTARACRCGHALGRQGLRQFVQQRRVGLAQCRDE